MVGMIGVANIALLWPSFWVFDAARASGWVAADVAAALPTAFELPQSAGTWALSIANASLATAYNCCFMGALRTISCASFTSHSLTRTHK
jgi:hypothetical protein